jgi:LysR family transcriptional regulator, regulator for genes of the gallate degradation pathway
MKVADLNLRHLRALAAAVRARSISGAAATVGLSQPAVTQAIARLEASTGTILFERSAAGVAPTDAAILLGARSDSAAAAIAEAMGAARRGGIGAAAGAAEAVTMAQLGALIAFAEGGSYAAGAVLAGVSQPTLHRSVADLERSCGVTLVERAGRGAILTGAGERLVRAFRLTSAELQAGIDELAVLVGRDQGTIRLAAAEELIDRVIVPALLSFLAEHPAVVVELSAYSQLSLEEVRDGRIDALLTSGLIERAPDGVEVSAIGDDPFVVAARAEHALAGSERPGLMRLASFGWALPPEGSAARAAFSHLFMDGGLYPPTPGVTCPSLAALAEITAGTDMLTILPRMMVETLAERLVAIGAPLPQPPGLFLATRTGWAPTPAQATLIEELRRAATPLHLF